MSYFSVSSGFGFVLLYLNFNVTALTKDPYINCFVAGKQLMLQVAELVPRHPGRTKKQEAPSTSSAAAGSSKSGKGGRKKR